MLSKPLMSPNRLDSTPFLCATRQLLQVQANLISEDIELPVVIAGGTAVQIWTRANTTVDIDCEFEGRFYPKECTIPYLDEDGEEKSVYIDRNYTPTLAVMHEDYIDDAVFVEDIGKLAVHVLHPIDLVLSKITRWQEHDRRDVGLLVGAGLVDAETLKERADEALRGAIGNLSMFKINLNEALTHVQQSGTSIIKRRHRP
ncbi:MAG: DUF6036 family nucleotidyltransferase [Sedimenticola sp.]